MSADFQRNEGDGCVKIGCLGIIVLVVFAAIIGDITGTVDDHSPVSQSQWNGSVEPVMRYLRDNLKDPDSLEIIHWSPLKKLSSGYAIRCKYRAKNSFGGYEVEEKVFVMDEAGNITYTY